MRYWLVMPAAGAGRRFGGAKQFAVLGGRTVLDLALQPFIEDAQCRAASWRWRPTSRGARELARALPARFITGRRRRRARAVGAECPGGAGALARARGG